MHESCRLAKRCTNNDQAEWDELNKKFANDPSKANNAFNAIADNEWTDDEDVSEDDGPKALKKINKQTISANNLSRFETAPIKASSPVPDVSAVDVEDIDEVL